MKPAAYRSLHDVPPMMASVCVCVFVGSDEDDEVRAQGDVKAQICLSDSESSCQ